MTTDTYLLPGCSHLHLVQVVGHFALVPVQGNSPASAEKCKEYPIRPNRGKYVLMARMWYVKQQQHPLQQRKVGR